MISTLTSVHLDMDPTLAAALSAIAVVLLIVILALKELVSTLDGRWGIAGRYLNVAILPLLFTFVITVALKVADVLNK